MGGNCGRRVGCFMDGDDASTFQLLFLIPALCRAAVFVEQSFQYLLKLSTVLGRASFSVEIELLNVCTEMFPIELFYKAKNKLKRCPA